MAKRPWTELPDILWLLIMEKLLLEDIITLGSVSRWFQSFTRDFKRCSPVPRVPWLMSPDTDGSYTLYDIATEKVRRIPLPELTNTAIIGTSHGWLVYADNRTADIGLFNPFTRKRTQLPVTASLPGVTPYRKRLNRRVMEYKLTAGWLKEFIPDVGGFRKRDKMMSKALVKGFFKSAYLEIFETGYAVVLAYGKGNDTFLAFARAGDDKWSALEIPCRRMFGWSFNFLDGHFYMMDVNKGIVCYDFRGPDVPRPALLPLPSFCQKILDSRYEFLLGMQETGHLLQVSKSRELGFRFFVMDPKGSREWGEVTNFSDLGGISMFLTFRSYHFPASAFSVQLPREDPRMNHLYVEDIGYYSVFDMKVRRHQRSFTEWAKAELGVEKPTGVFLNPVFTDLAVPSATW